MDERSRSTLVDRITDRVLARLRAEGLTASGDLAAPETPVLAPTDAHLRAMVAQGACRFSCEVKARSLPPDLASTIDHTLLKPDATEAEIRKICVEAREYHFASVCVNPHWVDVCAAELRGSSVAVCTVVGFPLGATTTATKAFEAAEAVRRGATEVDMVINIGALKSGDLDTVHDDIEGVVRAVAGQACVKVILETALLNDDEKVTACALAKEAGAHYVKTSTGFAGGGATVEDVRLMRRVVGSDLGVKASGGIRDRETAEAMIEAGANRIGASAGVKIVASECGSASS